MTKKRTEAQESLLKMVKNVAELYEAWEKETKVDGKGFIWGVAYDDGLVVSGGNAGTDGVALIMASLLKSQEKAMGVKAEDQLLNIVKYLGTRSESKISVVDLSENEQGREENGEV